MAQKLIAAMPDNFDLPANYIVQIAAVDPTSGAGVSGVKVSNVVLQAAPVTPETADSQQAVLPLLFVPIDPGSIG